MQMIDWFIECLNWLYFIYISVEITVLDVWLSSIPVDRGLDIQTIRTTDNKIRMCYFSTKHKE